MFLHQLKYLFSFFLLLFAVTSAATTAVSTGSEFERAVSRIANSKDSVGLAVAVVRKGEVSFLGTYGVREIGSPEKIDAHTTFRIASLSKAFAATVAGQLDSNKQLSLDSPIFRYNQEFQLADARQAKTATLLDVLSHRLSLPPYAYDNLLEAGVMPAKILREMEKVTPICRVGTCYAYQNVGFNMITSAIESATKQSYESIVRNLLFEPLGMSGASFGMRDLKKEANWARSHRRRSLDSWQVVDVKPAYYEVPAAGGVNANILDMTKWLKAQMGHAPTIIPEETLKRLQSPIVETPAELRRNRRISRLSEAYYGLGWRVYKYAGHTVVNHSGAVEGYGARIAFLPELDVGIVLLSNSRSREFWEILPMFLDYELGLENELLSQTDLNSNQD